jgi:hypothetical protein
MNEGYPLIVRRPTDRLGERRSYYLSGARVDVPSVIEALLPDGSWLKVCILENPEDEKVEGFVHVGVTFDGGSILCGDVPRETRFRWPKTLESRTKAEP